MTVKLTVSGQVIVTGESYEPRASAIKGIESSSATRPPQRSPQASATQTEPEPQPGRGPPAGAYRYAAILAGRRLRVRGVVERVVGAGVLCLAGCGSHGAPTPPSSFPHPGQPARVAPPAIRFPPCRRLRRRGSRWPRPATCCCTSR
jgi:hypothetical protein